MRRALTGNWRDEHLFLLRQSLAIFDDLTKRVQECDAKIEALLAPLQRHAIKLKASPRGSGKNNPTFDVRQAMANWAGVDLTRIDGLGVSVVMKLLSEIGTDLSRFANVKHFCSWLGLCPGTKVGGGKVLSAATKRLAHRARQALKMAAMSLSRSDSALGRSTGSCARAWTSRGQIRRSLTSSPACLPHVGVAGDDPYARARRQADHASSLSARRTLRTLASSTVPRSRTRAAPISISIVQSMPGQAPGVVAAASPPMPARRVAR